MSRDPFAGFWIDPNFPNPNGPKDAPIIIYGYTPSLVVGLLGVILFSISTILHLFQLFRYRTWYFIPVAVGTALEVVGYVFRILSSRVDPYNVIYFVIEFFMIVVAPVFFSASIYTILTFLIKAVGAQYSPLRPRLILGIFIASDVIATVIQIVGAASIGTAEANRSDPTTPNHVLTAGLAFQVFSFLVFIILLAVFLYRTRKVLSRTELPFIAAVCVSTLLIYLRTCFRLAETAQGVQHALFTHEAYFGALEFAPVILAVLVFNIYHPGKWIPKYGRGL